MGIRKDVGIAIAAGGYVGTSMQADHMERVVYEYKMATQGFTDIDDEEEAKELWTELGMEKAPHLCFYRESDDSWVYSTKSCQEIKDIKFEDETMFISSNEIISDPELTSVLSSENSRTSEELSNEIPGASGLRK